MTTHIPPVTVLSPLVTRLLACNPGNYSLQGTNTYVIGNGRRRILIDTGEGKPEFSPLLSTYLRDNSIEISDVLITHGHPDHDGGVNQVMDVLTTIQPQLPRVFKRSNPDWDKHREFKHQIINLTDEQRFECEGATLTGFHTPGHAIDHFVFWLEQEQALFSGDNVLGEGTSVFFDLSTYIKSLNKMMNIPGLQHMYPGHGPLINDGIAKVTQYIRHRMVRENEILKQVGNHEGGISIEQLVEIMYPTVPANVKRGAQRGVQLHLEKLLDDGRVLASDQDGMYHVAPPTPNKL